MVERSFNGMSAGLPAPNVSILVEEGLADSTCLLCAATACSVWWLKQWTLNTALVCCVCRCWTCGGFSEVKFVWENKFGLVVTHVYLHLQTDYFRPQAMHVDKGDAIDKNMCGANHNLYTLHRQVPPGRQHFFFTWDTDKTMLMIQHRDEVCSTFSCACD